MPQSGTANKTVLGAEADSLEWSLLNSESGHHVAAARSNLVGGRMYVKFKGGVVYVYYEVPVEVFRGLVAAPSGGKYLHAKVYPNYAYDRIY